MQTEHTITDYDLDVLDIDRDAHRFEWFGGNVMDKILELLRDNSQHPRASHDGFEGADEIIEEIFEDNVYEISVRDKPFADARVTVWLNDCPTFANTATTVKLISLNGRDNCHCVIDVRPF